MNDRLHPTKDPLSNAFSNCELGSDSDEQFFILNFGTRLLTAFTDKEILIDIALETLADFSRGKRVAILSLDDKHERLEVDGVFLKTKSARRNTSFPVEGTVLEKLMFQKVVAIFPLTIENDVPLPAENGRAGEDKCLCLPLLGASFRVVGLATIEIQEDHHLTFFEMQQLRILSTVLAVSLDNAKLFARVIHDSLTNLYTRRFYEIRVEEELMKLKRNRGCLSVILFDLDNFKKVNDLFGHLMGDTILRQFGILLQDHVRKGSTLISRYGGEEFILLMPDAHIDEAINLAHRIMSLCSGHPFGENASEIRMTVSGGVAFTDHTELLSPRDLFQRADTALYEAKNNGRNRIVAWKNH
jgi:two-component system, cell cycle response regulator